MAGNLVIAACMAELAQMLRLQQHSGDITPATGARAKPMTTSTSDADAVAPMAARNLANVRPSDSEVPAGSGTRSTEVRPERRGGRSGGDGPGISLDERVDRLERSNRRLRVLLMVLMLGLAYVLGADFLTQQIQVNRTLLESNELKLLDNSGNARLFLRMYSKVPVLQLLDRNGKPRLSLGLRFDDTPFIDLSDKTGRTRGTFEMTEQDEPTLRLFDAQGETVFKIN